MHTILEMSQMIREALPGQLQKDLEAIISTEFAKLPNYTKINEGKVSPIEMVKNVMKKKNVHPRKIFQRFFPLCVDVMDEFLEFINNDIVMKN